jgi:NAD(P)-dependent dehydrogenase (short-subunit alcohol dehydrogenase family)
MGFPKVVVVTGASAGVGRATVREFARRGADVGLLARGGDGLRAAALVANAVAPGLLDRYLGRTGYRSQQTDQPRDPDRSANLWAPVPGDPGAHGRFDDRAHDRSLRLWAATHRGRVALPALHALVGSALLLAPGRLLRRVGDPADRRARLLARVLGARHLGQAAALGAAGGGVAARLGAAVDGLHGTSMVALALAARRHRGAAMAAAAAAGALAALELTEASDG